MDVMTRRRFLGGTAATLAVGGALGARPARAQARTLKIGLVLPSLG
jgi:ABC-type sugar transport system substrate-binding protein